MQILDQQGDGPGIGETDQPVGDRVQGAPPLCLGAQREWRVAIGERQAQQPRQQRHDLCRWQPDGMEAGFELGELVGHAVLWRQVEALLDQPDRREQRAVLVIRRAAALEPGVAFGRQPLAQHVDQARLAHARLALEQHHLSAPLLDLRPALDQQRELRFAADQRRQPGGGGELQAGLHAARLQHAVRSHGFGDALEGLRAEVLEHEEPLDEAPRRGADDDRTGARHVLQARGDVYRAAEDVVLRVVPRRAHDQAGVNADAQRDAARAQPGEVHSDPSIQARDLRLNGERGAHRAGRIILVRLRVAEIDQQPVAEVARDVAVEALHLGGAGLVVGVHHVAELFRVELLGQRGRVHHVAKHDRELPPLSLLVERRASVGRPHPLGAVPRRLRRLREAAGGAEVRPRRHRIPAARARAGHAPATLCAIGLIRPVSSVTVGALHDGAFRSRVHGSVLRPGPAASIGEFPLVPPDFPCGTRLSKEWRQTVG